MLHGAYLVEDMVHAGPTLKHACMRGDVFQQWHGLTDTEGGTEMHIQSKWCMTVSIPLGSFIQPYGAVIWNAGLKACACTPDTGYTFTCTQFQVLCCFIQKILIHLLL